MKNILCFAAHFSKANRFLSTVEKSAMNSEKQDWRLSQLIANTGLCSRKEAEHWIHDGRVSVNNQESRSPALKVGVTDVVHLDGERVSSRLVVHSNNAPLKIWAVNKLSGELVDDNDPIKNRPLMMQRLKKVINLNAISAGVPMQLKPITRMDFNGEGLCLVTTNSNLARTIANSNLTRYFRARIHGLVTDSKLEGLRSGLYIDGKKQLPLKVRVERTAGTISWVKIEAQESNSRAIKDSFLRVHWNVTRLISIGFGPYRLDNLAPGAVKEVKLTPEILSLLRSASKR